MESSPPRIARPTRARSRVARALRAFGLVLLAVLGAGFLTTRVLQGRAEDAFPQRGRIVEVRGTGQHVLEAGSGAPIVFVHGAFGGLQDFVETIWGEVARSHRCIAWDRPGHGYSERPERPLDPGAQAELLLELLAELHLDEPPLLVGFSYGGAVVLAAALQAPERLRGVVMLNGPSHPWRDPLDLSYRFPAWPLVGPLLTETCVAPLGALTSEASVADAFAPAPVAPAFEGSPIALALRPASYRANAEDVRLLKPFLRAQVPRYPGLAVPVTMVVAEGDRVVSPTIHSLQLAAASENVRVVRVAGAGHQILYSHPERVLRELERAAAR